MNKEDEDRQMRETRSLLQKAGQRNASLDTRREALRRLISLTHTPSAELKVYAAQNLGHYFKDFPNLEEDVIDSVYDICEDPDAQVRIEGYKAIVALSTGAKKWTRRNTDVLVQLLQSDEPQELAEIKTSLIAHVNLDAVAAISVMCDHCFLDPDLGNEEREDRERLRKIVLRFLATDAKKHILPHFRGPTTEPEQVFRAGLMKAIAKADVQDTEVIVKDLLLPLGSYTPFSQHGEELLQALLDKVKLMFTELKSKPGSVSLSPIKTYLVLMECVVERRAADPRPLLRFYSTTLIGKMALQKLDQESQFTVIEKLAAVLEATEDERPKGSAAGLTSDELTTLRNAVVDACPHILDSVSKAPPERTMLWKACVVLLTVCRRRQQDQRWEPPQNFTRSVQDLSTRANRVLGESQNSAKDVATELQKLLKELHIEPSELPLPSQAARGGPPSMSKRKFEGELLPTSGSGSLRATGNVATKSHDRPITPGRDARSTTSTSAQRSTAPVPAPRGPKLINRLGGDVSMGERSSVSETPALLRRMSSSDTGSTNGSQTNPQRISRSSSENAGVSSSAPTIHELPMMLSIKGAASKLLSKDAQPQSPTLMDRMQVDKDFSHDGQVGRKRRKWTQAGG